MLRRGTAPNRPDTSPRTLRARTPHWVRIRCRSGTSSRTVDCCRPCRLRSGSCSRRNDRRPNEHSFHCSRGTPEDIRKRPPRPRSLANRPCFRCPTLHRGPVSRRRYQRPRFPQRRRLRSRPPPRHVMARSPHTHREGTPTRPALVRMTCATASAHSNAGRSSLISRMSGAARRARLEFADVPAGAGCDES